MSILFLFILSYSIWTTLAVGFRNDHVSFIVFISMMMVFHTHSRKLVYYFIFFILFWVIYDSMRVYPNYLFNPVHILEPYILEKQLFGISLGQEILTPNEYFNIHTHSVLDFMSGLFYLSWMPVPLGLGIYFYFKDRKLLLQFSAAFLFANLLGFCLYYLYPAAPPWYFAKYGDAQLFDIPGDAASLVRFDQLVGFPVFTNIYTKNANVFAAIPSLHAAYPVVTWYYARKKKLTWASIFIFVDIIGIWFAAVYSFHHYFIDVLLGFGCAIIALVIFDGLLIKTRLLKWFERYYSFIES